jgi:hypothetical protein
VSENVGFWIFTHDVKIVQSPSGIITDCGYCWLSSSSALSVTPRTQFKIRETQFTVRVPETNTQSSDVSEEYKSREDSNLHVPTSCHRNTIQNYNTKRINEQFNTLNSPFKTSATDQNYNHKDVNSALNSGKASHKSLQKSLCSNLLFKGRFFSRRGYGEKHFDVEQDPIIFPCMSHSVCKT